MSKMKNVLVALEFYRGPLFEGIAEYARTHNWHLSLEMLPNPGNIPWGWDGDGILTMLIKDETELIDFLDKCDKPTVNLEGRRLTTPYPRVLSDTLKAAEMAFGYFRDKGFLNFAFYGYRHSVRGRDFIRIVKENNFECNALYEWNGSWQGELEITAEWLKQQQLPLAVFCWTDYAGARFIDMAHSLGYRIPEDISVLGMDNEELICDCAAVRLSSIRTDIKTVGYLGAALLDKIMNGEDPNEPSSYIAPREVVERGSSDTLAIGSPHVAAAIRFMKENYSKCINISDVTKNATISRRGLEKAFLRFLNKTPHEVLLKIRLDKAKTILRQTDDKIAAISRQVGLPDPKHFSTLFKQHHGLSPREYRMKWRKQS